MGGGDTLRAEDLKAALVGAGAEDVTVEPIAPSLEDVFLAVVGAGAERRANQGATA